MAQPVPLPQPPPARPGELYLRRQNKPGAAPEEILARRLYLFRHLIDFINKVAVLERIRQVERRVDLKHLVTDPPEMDFKKNGYVTSWKLRESHMNRINPRLFVEPLNDRVADCRGVVNV